MELVLGLLVIQGLLGAFDNLWHHEITEALPSKPGARKELMLHSAREFIYAALFVMLGWASWHGFLAFFVMFLLLVEVGITLWDFIEEDLTRKLPPLERVLHTVLAMNYGAVLILLLPQLWQWGLENSKIVPVDYGWISWVMSLYAIGVLLWGIRDLMAVIRLGPLQTPEFLRKPIMVSENTTPKTILITGATGFIGKALTRQLLSRGEKVLVLTRDREKARNIFGPLVETLESLAEIPASKKIDSVINLAGEAIIGLPWTKARRKSLFASRINTTGEIVELIRRLEHKPAVLVSASAVGYYGDGGERELDESGPCQKVFVSELCQQWEAEARKVESLGVRLGLLRFGIVLGEGGGALPGFATPVAFGLGCIFGKGQQWMPWIHLGDAIRLIDFVLDRKDIKGVVNAVAPGTIRHRVFMKTLARKLERPLLFRLPGFLLRAGLGEMSVLFLEGQRVIPAKAEKSGFTYTFPTLDQALADLYPDNPVAAALTSSREPGDSPGLS
ncbi:TIGR01777 family oxidoreductase [Kiloniella laminariae]|uniref:TIGR01777 family oxidoreductase n=1 Tax=Kiloniella laminariae TaxID=454162 RepID=A0ABT4LJK2_9PROT|nr:TIGR01777 family oxidoreductase [Kiloniella laminariae]MCZ4281290.1 TIGR01777 family oxidoreductase [Kiloniella laminariae]